MTLAKRQLKNTNNTLSNRQNQKITTLEKYQKMKNSLADRQKITPEMKKKVEQYKKEFEEYLKKNIEQKISNIKITSLSSNQINKYSNIQ